MTTSLTPLLGEYLWHSLTLDASIAQVSEAHLDAIEKALELQLASSVPPVILEVGAYAHFTGYRLADERGADVTLLDMSPSTLRVGLQEALRAGAGARGPIVKRVAADFHELPFPDGVFDLVFIASAVHHTLRWRTVVDELMRVTAPGGLVVIENEPCRRAFCAYAFRCNRSAQFTPLEQELDKQGLLRTVAEPYLGSRPETLFGMVENTSIPLDQLVDVVRESCDLLVERYSIEDCLGPFERRLIEHAAHGAGRLVSAMGPELIDRMASARAKETDVTRGLGFILPDDDRMLALLEDVAPELAALPSADDPAYRYRVASMFGAAVKLIARKRDGVRNPWRLRGGVSEIDDVFIAHPEPLRALLSRRQTWVPDIQAAAQEEVAACFAEPGWSFGRAPTGIATVMLRGSAGAIQLPPRRSDEALLFLRCNFGLKSPLAAEFRAPDSTLLVRVDLFQSEARLVRLAIPAGVDRIDVRLIEADGTLAPVAACIVSVALGLEVSGELHEFAPALALQA